jgi:hypothetical protein
MNANYNRQFHTLLTQTGLMQQKVQIIQSITNFRVVSSKDMTDHEGLMAIKWLQSQKVVNPPKNTEGSNNSQIKMALAQFAQMGYVREGGLLDYHRINTFCQTNTAAKKRLDKMDKTELTATIKQLQIINKKTVLK